MEPKAMHSKAAPSEDALRRARKIRLVAFDVDGVLTDGKLIYTDDGRECKAFDCRDGHGFKMLQSHGIRTAIISGRDSPAVSRRAEELGIELVYQGQQDKAKALDKLLAAADLSLPQIAYVGDDVVDLPVLLRVGLAIAPQYARPLVARHCHWQTPSNGGHGAAREVCEMILRAQNLLDDALRGDLLEA